jgi:hypothetical protein
MPFMRKSIITHEFINLRETDESGMSIGQVVDANIAKAIENNETLHEVVVGWESQAEWQDTVQAYMQHNGTVRTKKGKMDWKDI